MPTSFDGLQKEASSLELELSLGIEIPTPTPCNSWGAQAVLLSL